MLDSHYYNKKLSISKNMIFFLAFCNWIKGKIVLVNTWIQTPVKQTRILLQSSKR